MKLPPNPTPRAPLGTALRIPAEPAKLRRQRGRSLAARLIAVIRDAQENGTNVSVGVLEAARRLLKKRHYTLPELGGNDAKLAAERLKKLRDGIEG